MHRTIAVAYACLAGLCGLAAGDAGARIAATGSATDRDLAQLIVGVSAAMAAAACAAAVTIEGASRR